MKLLILKMKLNWKIIQKTSAENNLEGNISIFNIKFSIFIFLDFSILEHFVQRRFCQRGEVPNGRFC